MDSTEFKIRAKEIYQKIFQAFEKIDPDLAEAEMNLDSVSIVFFDGVKFIVNKQPPVQQIWLATKKNGLHFNFDGASQEWLCDRSGEEFFVVLSRSISEKLKTEFSIN